MDFVRRIDDLMAERNWTYYRLATESGVSQTTISTMRKHKNIKLNTLIKLCNAFQISLQQFFSEGNDPVELTQDQQEVLRRWSALTKKDKDALNVLIDDLI